MPSFRQQQRQNKRQPTTQSSAPQSRNLGASQRNLLLLALNGAAERVSHAESGCACMRLAGCVLGIAFYKKKTH